MIISNYLHRLHKDFDLDAIRRRAGERGRLWDDMPDLYFKAFLLRERGKLGARANSYSSLYLWRTEDAFSDFLMAGRLDVVTETFGRPSIRNRTVLDARKGTGAEARYAQIEETLIPVDVDITGAVNAEKERNQAAAVEPGVVAAAVGIDPANWTVMRVRLFENPPPVSEASATYEILYLAKPLLDGLAT